MGTNFFAILVFILMTHDIRKDTGTEGAMFDVPTLPRAGQGMGENARSVSNHAMENRMLMEGPGVRAEQIARLLTQAAALLDLLPLGF